MVRRGRGAGASLIEALIAMLVMGLGLLAVAALQGRLRQGADAAQQRAEAVRLAQAEMARLRAYVALQRDATLPAEALVFSEIADGEQQIDGVATRYTLTRRVQALDDGGLALHLRVRWRDATLAASAPDWQLDWQGALAAQPPALSLAAFVPPAGGVAQRRLLERHPAIPLQARRLDAEHSLLRPLAGASRLLVLDNRSGEVSGVCEVDAAAPLAAIRAADLGACAHNLTQVHFLLSGLLRVDAARPPPAGLGITVRLDAADRYPNAPSCDIERAGSAWRYHCLLPARLPTLSDPQLHWSGRSLVTGLALEAGGWRVCRYSDDVDGNGRIDNAEHPADYRRVASSLAQQNFLLLPFETPCPAGQRMDLDAGLLRNTVTAAHQP